MDINKPLKIKSTTIERKQNNINSTNNNKTKRNKNSNKEETYADSVDNKRFINGKKHNKLHITGCLCRHNCSKNKKLTKRRNNINNNKSSETTITELPPRRSVCRSRSSKWQRRRGGRWSNANLGGRHLSTTIL